MDLAQDSQTLARALFVADPSRRYMHVRGVAQRALGLPIGSAAAHRVLLAGAWVHDVGYAALISKTGFHPLDGARYLRFEGYPLEVCSMVAHHSEAVVEAELRGLRATLEEEFPPPSQFLADALCYCDMTVGPAGEPMTVHERLSEIRGRYGPDHVVTEFVDLAEPRLVASVERVESWLASQHCEAQPM